MVTILLPKDQWAISLRELCVLVLQSSQTLRVNRVWQERPPEVGLHRLLPNQLQPGRNDITQFFLCLADAGATPALVLPYHIQSALCISIETSFCVLQVSPNFNWTEVLVACLLEGGWGRRQSLRSLHRAVKVRVIARSRILRLVLDHQSVQSLVQRRVNYFGAVLAPNVVFILHFYVGVQF